jgi:predicted dehydrogenase
MRILIAGLGAIGQRHARNLRALRGGDLELLAYRRRRLRHVVTESLGRDDTRDVEAELGVTVYDDLDAALMCRPDAAFVCTPSSQHLEIAQRAADAGCHLFVEKPVSHSLAGTDRLLAVIAAKRLVALTGCQWRFHPCVRALKRVLTGGALGAPYDTRIDYAEYLPDWHPYEDYRQSYAARSNLGGGVILTQIHDYDLAFWLFGMPRSVQATGGQLGDLEIDVEDTVDATMQVDAGAVRVRQSFCERPSRRGIVVRGVRASAALDLLAARLTFEPPVAPAISFPAYRRNQMFVEEVDHFLNCIDGTAQPLTPLSEGVLVLKIALAVRESMQTGRTIDIT